MKKITVNKGFVSRKLGKKTMIFDGEKSLLITLNETASEIFKRLLKGEGKEEITLFLKSEYGLNNDTAKRDVDDFLKVLAKENIISIGNKADHG